jgi:hypothetical protein
MAHNKTMWLARAAEPGINALLRTRFRHRLPIFHFKSNRAQHCPAVTMASPSVLRPGTPDAWRISFTGRWPESAPAIVKPERSEQPARDEDHGQAGRVGDRCLTPPRPGQGKPQQRRSGFMIPTHVLNRRGRGVKTLADALGADLMRKPSKTPRNTAIARNSSGGGRTVLGRPGGRPGVLSGNRLLHR